MDDESAVLISLALNELMLMETLLTPSELGMDSKDPLPLSTPSYDTRLKIGAAMLEAAMVSPLTLRTTKQEIQVFLERVNLLASWGPDKEIGLRLKTKLYQAALSLESEQALKAVGLGDMPIAPEEKTAREVVDELGKCPNKNDADTNQNAG